MLTHEPFPRFWMYSSTPPPVFATTPPTRCPRSLQPREDRQQIIQPRRHLQRQPRQSLFTTLSFPTSTLTFLTRIRQRLNRNQTHGAATSNDVLRGRNPSSKGGKRILPTSNKCNLIQLKTPPNKSNQRTEPQCLQHAQQPKNPRT